MVEPSEIKSIRQKLNLTQNQFAKIAGVSQSLIAKIEAGKIDPTYSNFSKIRNALDNYTGHHEKIAEEIMNKKIISIKQDDTLITVNHIMRKHGISQIPVLESNGIIGIVTESSILEANFEKIVQLKAKDVMIDSPPIIGPKTSLKQITGILKHFQLVFVKDKGEFVGIITKSDLLNILV